MHCKHCGSTAGGESVSTRGSDTVPAFECNDCGGVYRLKCDCDSPEDHNAENPPTNAG